MRKCIWNWICNKVLCGNWNFFAETIKAIKRKEMQMQIYSCSLYRMWKDMRIFVEVLCALVDINFNADRIRCFWMYFRLWWRDYLLMKALFWVRSLHSAHLKVIKHNSAHLMYTQSCLFSYLWPSWKRKI